MDLCFIKHHPPLQTVAGPVWVEWWTPVCPDPLHSWHIHHSCPHRAMFRFSYFMCNNVVILYVICHNVMKGGHLSFWQKACRVCQLQHNKGSSRAKPEHSFQATYRLCDVSHSSKCSLPSKWCGKDKNSHVVNHTKPAWHRTCAAWPGDGNQHLLVLGEIVIPTVILEALQAHTANTTNDNKPIKHWMLEITCKHDREKLNPLKIPSKMWLAIIIF